MRWMSTPCPNTQRSGRKSFASCEAARCRRRGRAARMPATYAAVAGWLESTIDAAVAARPNPGRHPAVHRLNRAEYTNAIRDLLAVDVDAAALLPPDDSGYGFDNIADVLSISPMLTERYLSAALKISRVAVGDPTLRPVTETFAVNKYLKQEDRVSDDLPFGSRGGLAVRYYFPVDADYSVKIFFDRTYDGRVRGLAEPHRLEVRLDGVKVQDITVGGESSTGRGQRNVAIDGTEVRFAATAGPKRTRHQLREEGRPARGDAAPALRGDQLRVRRQHQCRRPRSDAWSCEAPST